MGRPVHGAIAIGRPFAEEPAESPARTKTLALLVAVFVCGLVAFTSVSRAEQGVVGDNAYSALRHYVRQIGSEQIQTGSVRKAEPEDVFAALRDFSQRLTYEEPKLGTPSRFKTADADNAFDALRGFFQKQNGNQPPVRAETPNSPATRKPHEPVVQGSYVGTKACLNCHASQATAFEHTLMGRLLKQGKMQCETCHGPGSEHVRLGGGRGVGGIISYRPNDTSRTAEEHNAICLGCHEKGDRTLWHGSVHETRGLMCTNCHTIMKDVSLKNQLKTKFQPDTCFQCHKDIRAKMARSSHMPVLEGKMVCTNCHNPHGSYTESLLKEATVNDVCFQCHAEKRGPFLWEHPPVVENCLNCHDPHGTINDNLLKVSRPRLCQRCHNAANNHPANPRNPMSVFAINSGCVNCHSQIHGSNSPGGQFFHR